MSEKQSRKRLNVIDFVIIVIVLGCIAGIIARYNIVNRIVVDSDRDEVEISFVVTSISPMISEAVNDGDVFYSESSGNCIGTLIRHEVKNSEIVYSNENGEPVVGSDQTKRDVTGTLRAYGIMGSDGFMLEGTQFLAAGKKLTIQSLEVQISVIITEIRPV